MTTPSNDQAFGNAPAPVGRWAKVAVSVVVLGVVGAIGARTVAALHTRDAVTREREQVAQAAAQGPSAGAVATVRVARGEPATWEPSVHVEGSLKPKQEADIGFKASGRLGVVRGRLGAFVKQGEVLAALDQEEAVLAKKAAEAQVRAADAQVGLAEDAERRTSSMVQKGALSDATGVQAKGQLELGTAQADAARAQLALANAAMQNHTLTAPFSGFVTKAPTSPGGVVSAGMPLFRIEDLSTLRLAGTIGENDAPLVHIGDPVRIDVDGRTAEGRLTIIVPSLDVSTRRIPIEAEVPSDPAKPLMAGSFVRASVRGGPPIPVLRLPAAALRPGSQDEIFVVKQGKLVSRHVRFAAADDGTLLVRSGLLPGDDVLLAPPAEAKDGDNVPVGTATSGAAP